MYPRVVDHPDAVATVDSTTLHEIFEGTPLPGQRCRLLKMDCEGMEYEILPQSRTLDRIDCLAVEFHEAAPDSRDVRYTGDGGDARALAERCASFFAPERMRIAFCPKRD